MPTEKTRNELHVDAPPDAVIAALVDFGPDRPRIWRETCHPAVYRVHRLGETDADVTEGIPFTWSRERYDWSEPSVVTLTQLESNVARDGAIRYKVRPDGPGSVITCDRRREFYGPRGWVAFAIMSLVGRAVIRRDLRAGIQRAHGRRSGA